MKIGERAFEQDGKVVFQRTFDPNPYLRRADLIREAQAAAVGWKGFQHIATIPGFMVEVWAKEAGVSMQDHAAIDELVDRKIKSGEISKLMTGKV